jgi:hypothetical protein
VGMNSKRVKTAARQEDRGPVCVLGEGLEADCALLCSLLARDNGHLLLLSPSTPPSAGGSFHPSPRLFRPRRCSLLRLFCCRGQRTLYGALRRERTAENDGSKLVNVAKLTRAHGDLICLQKRFRKCLRTCSVIDGKSKFFYKVTRNQTLLFLCTRSENHYACSAESRHTQARQSFFSAEGRPLSRQSECARASPSSPLAPRRPRPSRPSGACRSCVFVRAPASLRGAQIGYAVPRPPRGPFCPGTPPRAYVSGEHERRNRQAEGVGVGMGEQVCGLDPPGPDRCHQPQHVWWHRQNQGGVGGARWRSQGQALGSGGQVPRQLRCRGRARHPEGGVHLDHRPCRLGFRVHFSGFS